MQYLGAGEYAKAIDAFTAAIGSILADFESDGVPEQVYLLRYADKNLLSSIRVDNGWGDEFFLTDTH